MIGTILDSTDQFDTFDIDGPVWYIYKPYEINTGKELSYFYLVESKYKWEKTKN